MMIRGLFSLTTGAMLLTSTAASAQTVDFILEKSSETGPGTFELFADVSQDGNFGLAGFAVELFGAETNEVVAPKGFSGFLQAMIGFADNESLPDATVIFSTQSLLEADNLVTGFGQFPGTLLEVADVPGLARQVEYDAPLLLATGTYADASALSLGQVGATVLTSEDDNDAAIASTDPESFLDLRADFDGDSDVDGFDLGIWQTQFCNTPGCGILADADGDGDADGFDLGIWQTEFGRVLNADFDGDGDVDAFDLGIWQFPDVPEDRADADGDGDTDAFDLLVWQDQFGRGVEEPSMAVPEPATAALLTVAGALVAGPRRRTAPPSA